MVLVTNKKGDKKFSIHKNTYKLCKRYNEKIKNKKENTFVYGIFVGKKGSGKSLLAQRFGLIIDPELEDKDDKVALYDDEFMDSIIKYKNSTIIGDEGASICFRRNVMTKKGKQIGEFWQQVRQRNNCILICVPNLTLLDSIYLDPDDINFIVRVWETKSESGNTVKGNYEVYINFVDGKPKYANAYVKYMFNKKYGRKANKPPFTIRDKGEVSKSPKDVWHPAGENYLKRKENILLKYQKKKEVEKPKKKRTQTIIREWKQDLIVKAKEKNPNLTDGTIAKVLNLSRVRVNTLYNDIIKARRKE